MSITLERLTETYLKYKSKHYGHKEDYFAPLFIADKFDRKVEAVLPYCSIGKNEEGIEAYYIERGAKNLYLYHFEWGENFELFKDAYKRLVKDGVETIFGNGSTAYTGKLTTQLKMELEEYKDLINKVYICFVFNGDPESAEGSKVLESLREELESKKHFIDQFFGRLQRYTSSFGPLARCFGPIDIGPFLLFRALWHGNVAWILLATLFVSQVHGCMFESD